MIPDMLKQFFDGFPPIPVKRHIQVSEMSPFTKHIMEKYQVRNNTSTKLVCDLNPKRNYILHGRNLVYLLSLGIRIVHTHRGVTFRQSYWIRNFIVGNNGRRKLSRSQFELEFWKMINNST